MVKICNVLKGSPAYRAKICPEDMLVSINGVKVHDVLDYMFYSAEERVEIEYIHENQTLKKVILKNEYDDLGLEFETFLMDNKKSCHNKCVFCFIDQMPPNMRETLYFKDDDARLSFLQGNYVTLTNLSQSDVDRIIKMRLNINVSVHTTNPELRCKMMNNRFAGEKLKYIKQMSDSGLKMNFQIVLCPQLNDREELDRTLNDLGNLMPNIQSVAIVPVGLSKYRDGLYPLVGFDKESASDAINRIQNFQNRMFEKYGTRVAFPSDEFFLIAERELPEADYYEEYPQYENGVGMLRSILDELNSAIELCDESPENPRRVTIATGKAPYCVIKNMTEKIEKTYNNIECNVVSVRNDFFGETITVTGLITAQDLISQLKGQNLGDELIISEAMLMRDNDIFLDDLTVSDVESQLGIKIRKVKNDGFEFLDAVLGIVY
jgi:putative radical SAM enzyme (TIGR03279 family)